MSTAFAAVCDPGIWSSNFMSIDVGPHFSKRKRQSTKKGALCLFGK